MWTSSLNSCPQPFPRVLLPCFCCPSWALAMLLRSDEGGDGWVLGWQLYKFAAFRPAGEIDCLMLRSCSVDSHQGLCRQGRNKAQKLGTTITKYGKEFINHPDRKYLSACCHQQRLAAFPTAIRGSNNSKHPKQPFTTFPGIWGSGSMCTCLLWLWFLSPENWFVTVSFIFIQGQPSPGRITEV